MDVSRALTQIAEIHQQLAKAEVYRGYRPLPVAASGLIGLAAAALQERYGLAREPVAFVMFWAAVAFAAAAVGVSEVAYHYVSSEAEGDRGRTRLVVGQFLPAAVAAAAISAAFLYLDMALVGLLPGLWAMCFGMGVFASRPYLPRSTVFIAVFYYAAGMALLWRANGPAGLEGWPIGVTFGIGQLASALVLYRDGARAVDERAWTARAGR